MRCVNRVAAGFGGAFLCVISVCAVSVPAAFSSEARGHAGHFVSLHRSSPPVRLTPSQQRNAFYQARAQRSVAIADRAFAAPSQGFIRNNGPARNSGYGSGYGGYSRSYGGGLTSGATPVYIPNSEVRVSSPSFGGPVSINQIPAVLGIPAAPTPEPVLYTITTSRRGHTTMTPSVRASSHTGPRIITKDDFSIYGSASTGSPHVITQTSSSPHIIQIQP